MKLEKFKVETLERVSSALNHIFLSKRKLTSTAHVRQMLHGDTNTYEAISNWSGFLIKRQCQLLEMLLTVSRQSQFFDCL